MSEDQNRGLRDFSEYDSMTTKELEQILRSDAEAPVGQESDEELLFYVMGVLADRRNNTEVTGKTALEAYESFKQHYLPVEEKINSAADAGEQKKRSSILWLRRLTAAAAVLAVVIFGSMTVDVMGCNIWETVVTWAQETFHFGDEEYSEIDNPNANNELQYVSLQDALNKNQHDPGIVPTWIPDGYVLHDLIIDINPAQEIYVAAYQKEEQYLKITIRSNLERYPEQIEQSADFVETYESAGITYYLFSNYEMTRVAWISGFYECYISGELTIDQLKLMIDSIEEG